jgi:hypothetical protein
MDIKVQKQISEIVNKENERVDLKKSQVDNELQTQNRMLTLNNSYRKKYNDYNNIYVIFIIFLIILCGIIVVKRYLTIIPGIVYEGLYIILIPIFCIILYHKYLDISKRDEIYYDELKTNAPVIEPPIDPKIAEIKKQDSILKSGQLLSAYAGCVGSYCCSDTTVWDNGNTVCVAKEQFAAMNDVLVHGDLYFSSNKEPIKPNHPNEFENYFKI